MQTYTSANTSINSARLPSVYGRAELSAPFVLDYGCGRYTEHITAHLNEQGRALFPYDPFNQPEEVNRNTERIITLCKRDRFPIDVICSNVLNVIDDDDTVKSIAEQLEDIVKSTGGTGYVTVYEGDRSGSGRKTGADQYQRNEKLRSYLRFFRSASIHNGMIIIK